MLSACVHKLDRLVLVLELYLQALVFSLLVEDIVVEEDKDEDFTLWLLRMLVDLAMKTKVCQLIGEHLIAARRRHKQIVGLFGPLRSGVKLLKQFLCLFSHSVVGGFLRDLALLVAMVDFAVASPDYEVDSVPLLRSESEV